MPNVRIIVEINVAPIDDERDYANIALTEVHRVLSVDGWLSGPNRDVVDGCILSYLTARVDEECDLLNQ